MGERDWEDLVSGIDCTLCEPRPASSDSMELIQKLDVASLYLNRSQTYVGACILVYDTSHCTRIDELDADEWQRFAVDLQRAQKAIVKVVAPAHMNTESLGNVVPHLHFHLVPRYPDDGRWRDPIWLTDVALMPARHLDEANFQALLERLRKALD